jgi:hypothetical protein
MASDRASLLALRDLIADTDLTLETIPDLPRTARRIVARIFAQRWPWLTIS